MIIAPQAFLGLTPASPNVYLTNQSGAASWQGAWLDTANFPIMAWLFSWSAVAATVGQLGFDVTNDPNKAAANVVAIAGTAITTWYGTANGTVAAVAGASAIVTQNSWRFIRGVYVRTAGGGADQFQAFVHGRGGS